MFVLDNVAKYYRDGNTKRWILREFSYDFSKHQYICVAGPSGSGKSTLLNLLCGLVAVDEGSIDFVHRHERISLDTATPKTLREFRRHRIGFIYQFFNLIPTLTALENVLLPLELTRQRSLDESARERLIHLGLGDRFHAFPDELSGGEQQRLAVARAFAHNPDVILADEPTGNLDRDTATEVIDLLWRETARTNATLIVASHDERVSERCHDVLSLAL